MKKGEVIKFLVLRTIGNFLVLFALFGVLATFGPALYYEVTYRIVQARGIKYRVAGVAPHFAEATRGKQDETSPLGSILEKERGITPAPSADEGGLAAALTGPKEQLLIPKDTDFSILIPKLGANAKVIPNVDSTNEKEFTPILQQGVAHAKGTVFPGMKGNIYLFAHSTDNFWDVGRYNALFYLLKDLQVGDEIDIFFENRRHKYKVTETKIVDESDVAALTKSQEGNEEILILQTCWPPGTTWKRLLVFAKPV